MIKIHFAYTSLWIILEEVRIITDMWYLYEGRINDVMCNF